jgi:hypothetical protein
MPGPSNLNPTNGYKPNQQYNVSFKLDKVTKVPAKFAQFKFSLKTIKPSFRISDNGLRSSGTKNKMSFSAILETADIETGNELEKLVSATQNNRSLPIQWQHNDAAKTHIFTIDNIVRGNATSNLTVRWNGTVMNMDNKGEKAIAIPAIGDFKVLEVMPINEAQQYASILFSDPIAVGHRFRRIDYPQ